MSAILKSWIAGWLDGKPWRVRPTDHADQGDNLVQVEHAVLREARLIGVVVATSRINARPNTEEPDVLIVQALLENGTVKRRPPVAPAMANATAMGLTRGSALLKA